MTIDSVASAAAPRPAPPRDYEDRPDPDRWIALAALALTLADAWATR